MRRSARRAASDSETGEGRPARRKRGARLSTVLIVLGALLVAGALGLAAYNEWDSARAGEAAHEVLQELSTEIPADASSTEEASDEAPTVAVDGNEYLGVISIPSLDIELPVMADWDYGKLSVAPCRYAGSYTTDDLVICGHNYRSHFGPLTRVDIGADVYLTTVEGQRIHYVVGNAETIQPTAISQMIDNQNDGDDGAGDWDLTLFTCNLGGQTRHAVRCLRQES